jgi:hypothetical protein
LGLDIPTYLSINVQQFFMSDGLIIKAGKEKKLLQNLIYRTERVHGRRVIRDDDDNLIILRYGLLIGIKNTILDTKWQ